jgi:hypothetical protein
MSSIKPPPQRGELFADLEANLAGGGGFVPQQQSKKSAAATSSVPQAPQVPPQTNSTFFQATEQTKQPPTKDGNSWWGIGKWIIALLVIGVLVGVIIYFVSKNCSSKEPADENSNNNNNSVKSEPAPIKVQITSTEKEPSAATNNMSLGGLQGSALSMGPDTTVQKLKDAEEQVNELTSQLVKARNLLEFWTKDSKSKDLQIIELNKKIAQLENSTSGAAVPSSGIETSGYAKYEPPQQPVQPQNQGGFLP